MLSTKENKHSTLKHHIFCDCIDRFKPDEEKVSVIPPKHHYYDWIAQFLHQIPEVPTIKFRNKCYDKMVYLKSKNKSWKSASFGMCDDHYAIAFWGKCFTNMSFDTYDASKFN